MAIKGRIQEAAGYVEEETGEKLGSAKMARRGRNLRNKGRIKGGKLPKLTEPGTGDGE